MPCNAWIARVICLRVAFVSAKSVGTPEGFRFRRLLVSPSNLFATGNSFKLSNVQFDPSRPSSKIS
jgi:hypothetical protein